jgi:hypothetical protein
MSSSGSAASSNVGDALGTRLFSVDLAGGDCATVAGTKCLRLALAPERDLASDHHDAGVPVMGVIGVYVICSQTPIEHLITLTPKIGLKIALVHGGLRLLVPKSFAFDRSRPASPEFAA